MGEIEAEIDQDRRNRSRNRNPEIGWAPEHRLAQPETLLSKSQRRLEALAECPVLATLWEPSTMVGAYGSAAGDHFLGVSHCLWVLETSPEKALMARLGISAEASAGER